MNYRINVPLALGVLVLTACGGGDAAPSDETVAANATEMTTPVVAEASPADNGDCPWVSTAEASELIGVAVIVTGTRSTGSCYIQSEPLTFSGQITVIPDQTLDAIVADRGTSEPIEGLGERAAWVSTSSWEGRDLTGMVGVEQDGQGITVILSATAATPQPDVRAKTEALARAAIAQM